MSTVRHSARPVPATRQYLDRRITGTQAEVAAKVAIIRDSGRLVHVTHPLQTRDGHMWVNVRFLDRAPAVQLAKRRRRWPVVVTVTTTAVTVVAAAVAVAAWLVDQLVHAVTANAPTIIGVLLAVTLAAWLLLGKAGVCCPGLHCPGCKH